jgi:hypothetical protein
MFGRTNKGLHAVGIRRRTRISMHATTPPKDPSGVQAMNELRVGWAIYLDAPW